MFRSIRTFLPPLTALLVVAACSDLPTSSLPPPADLDPDGPIQENSVECGSETDPCQLPPAGNDPGDSDPVCDPYLTLNGCGDECEESAPGSPEVVGAEGCYNPGGTGPGTGGGSTEPPPPGCPEWDPYCEHQSPDTDHSTDAGADCIDLGCQLRDPSTVERQKVMDAINSLREDGFCAEVRASALRMVNRHLQVWDNRVLAKNQAGQWRSVLGSATWDTDRGGHVMYLFTNAINGWTIAHEAIHGIWNDNTALGNYYTHGNITPQGMNLDDTAKYCSRN